MVYYCDEPTPVFSERGTITADPVTRKAVFEPESPMDTVAREIGIMTIGGAIAFLVFKAVLGPAPSPSA